MAVRRHPNLFYSPQTSVKSKEASVGSAYVLPYEIMESGEIRVLVAQKKVLCYETQVGLERGDENLRGSFNIDMINHLSTYSKNGFAGTFYHGAGLATCLGGRLKKGESKEHAAAREFIEEAGIERKLTEEEVEQLIQEIMPHLFFIHQSPNFPGTYYSLDVSQCPKLSQFISNKEIAKENEHIAEEEKICDHTPPHTRNIKALPKKISEIHKLEWEKLEKVVPYLKKTKYEVEDPYYIEQHVEKGINLIIDYVKQQSHYSNNDERFKEFRKKISNRITNDVPSAAILIDNHRAGEALVATLSKENKKTEVLSNPTVPAEKKETSEETSKHIGYESSTTKTVP